MAKVRKSHLVRQEVTPFQPGTEARWRAEYRQAQYERALIGIQTDLFGAPAVEMFRASPKVPAPDPWTPDYAVEFFHDLPPEEQARWLATDPQTPVRPHHPGLPDRRGEGHTHRERSELAARRAAGADRQRAADARWRDGAARRVGRSGVVRRLCSPVFADHVYINLDLVGAERSEKIAFIELRDVEPIEGVPRTPHGSVR